MKTKAIFLIGTAFGIFLILTVAFQFRKKETNTKSADKAINVAPQKQDTAPSITALKDTVAIDSLLPDSTIAKQKKAQELGKKLDKIIDKSASKLVIEEKRTKELEKQDNKLGKLVQSAPFVQPMATSEIPAKNLSYPDTLKIITIPKKKSFIQKMNPFRRKLKKDN